MCGNLACRLKTLNAPPGSVRAYIFGGSAVHLYTRVRTSSDVDMEIESFAVSRKDLLLIRENLPPVDYDDPAQGPSTLVFDVTFNTTFGPLHEDYQDRARLLEAAPDSPLEVWLPAPEDVAVSKLGRFSEMDQEDIQSLLDVPGASLERFGKIAVEAAGYYVGNRDDLMRKIELVRGRYERRRKEG